MTLFIIKGLDTVIGREHKQIIVKDGRTQIRAHACRSQYVNDLQIDHPNEKLGNNILLIIAKRFLKYMKIVVI